jgi:hypothetical protein
MPCIIKIDTEGRVIVCPKGRTDFTWNTGYLRKNCSENTDFRVFLKQFRDGDAG